MMIAAMMVAAISAKAQNEVGQVTLKPTAGINISTVTNSNGNKSKVGFIGGFDFEYGVAENFGLTAGVFYSMQGDKADVALDGGTTSTVTEKLEYINIPILAQYYVIPGLAIKAGVQPGFLVKAKDGDTDIKSGCNKVNLAIPVGISYEYQSFVLDARYNIGLTKVYKSDFVGDRSCRNSVFSITLGYKFAL